MALTVRVRFPPSPTGELHVGNIRTALFNWLFARHHSGTFILRIEDTDVTRKVEGSVEYIMESLRWLDLDWDEGPDVGGPHGPYFQSQRLPLYAEAAKQLISQDQAYYCYCTPERLEQMRAEQIARKQPPGYDRRCRNLTPEERTAFEEQGIVPVVRLKAPLSGTTSFHDLLRGDITVENSTLDDLVLLKSDGYPTYHLANIIDDHEMEITHVMRGDEWIASTPRHILLYQAFGYTPPVFAHLPRILGPDRSKLSKRHGAVSVLRYRDRGYLPETVLNFLALLGWSLDDRTEIISREDLVRHFDLSRVGKTGAIFNIEKLDWMNGVYIRSLSPHELAQRLLPFLQRDLPPEALPMLEIDYVLRIVPLIQERLKRLDEARELTEFFFLPDLQYDPSLLMGKGVGPEKAAQALAAGRVAIERVRFEHDALEEELRGLAEDLALKRGDLYMTLRVALTGSKVSPPLFETMVVLGRERCLARIEKAGELLRASEA